jgi:hypothetical protein
MAELEELLASAGGGVDWPETPRFAHPAAQRGSRTRLADLLAATVVLAVGVAFAVPGARSAILHALGLEGVTIERVAVLPLAQVRPLAADLGRRVDEAAARRALGRPFVLPPGSGRPALFLDGGVVSTILQGREPLLLAELDTGGGEILKKVVGDSTGVAGLTVANAPGFWISGAPHLFIAPDASARLAGNVLLWESDGILYRLEGHGLTKPEALRVAAQIEGT